MNNDPKSRSRFEIESSTIEILFYIKELFQKRFSTESLSFLKRECDFENVTNDRKRSWNGRKAERPGRFKNEKTSVLNPS